MMAQPNTALLESVKQHPVLSWGGCDVVELEGNQFLVSVSSVEVGTKKLPQLRTTCNAKAKRELLLLIEGSTVSSTTEMTTSEESIDIDGVRSTINFDTFFESIREDANGFVQGMGTLGMWYSEDKTLFFCAIYKSIN